MRLTPWQPTQFTFSAITVPSFLLSSAFLKKPYGIFFLCCFLSQSFMECRKFWTKGRPRKYLASTAMNFFRATRRCPSRTENLPTSIRRM